MGLKCKSDYIGSFDEDITTISVLCMDIINGDILQRGSENLNISNILRDWENIVSLDPHLISRLEASLGKITISEDTVYYEIIIGNAEGNDNKITYEVFC